MKFADVLRGRVAEIDETRNEKIAELEAVTALAADESRSQLNDDETVRFEALTAEIGQLDEERAAAVARIAELDELAQRAQAASSVPTAPVAGTRTGAEVLEDRSATPSQLADALTRSLEVRVDDADNMAHVRSVLRRHLDPVDAIVGDETRAWARNLIARSQPVYVRSWAKYITGNEIHLSDEERAALSVGSNTNGGYLLPTHLDPTIILTNSGSSNAIRGISRVATLTEGITWNGVTSAGVTASWDGELVEVSDDSPTVGRKSVSTNVAQAFVQASIASTQDIAGLSNDVMMMFADARDRLEGAAHATGSGSSNQPRGIFTALDANTNVEIISQTGDTIGLVDIHKTYRSVPVRWRGRSTWLMHPLWSLGIKALGTAVSASFSGQLQDGTADAILRRPVVESDDAPSTTTTTANDNVLAFGDFSNYLIVDKPGGMSVEYIPHLFNTANNLPDGRRGWFAYWRTGADSLNDVAFRLLQEKTTA